jgi:hypothetical protein
MISLVCLQETNMKASLLYKISKNGFQKSVPMLMCKLHLATLANGGNEAVLNLVCLLECPFVW